MNRSSFFNLKVSATLLFLSSLTIFGGCTSTDSKSGGGNINSTVNQTNAVSQNVNANESPKSTESTNTKETDIFTTFKKDDDYKKVIRPKMVKDGWQPARNEDGDENCAGGGKICEEYPELNAGPSSPNGDAIFRWKKADKIVNIFTYDNQLYNRYEFEKVKDTEKSVKITGKYTYRYTEDYGGDISFNFKNSNKVDFEWNQEDVTWKGDGTWKLDEAKKTLTAIVEFEPDVDTPAASENTPPRKETYIFQIDGNNLKLIKTPSGMTAYTGKIFKK